MSLEEELEEEQQAMRDPIEDSFARNLAKAREQARDERELFSLRKLEKAIVDHVQWLEAQAEHYVQNPQVHSVFKECAGRLRGLLESKRPLTGGSNTR